MTLTTEKKKEIFKNFGGSETNTGSAHSQIALFTERINEMTEHLKGQPKDYATQRALQRLVGKRRSILDFLQKQDIEQYRKILNDLGIRK
ncbi:MAG: 30S ribosomal protein S15 [Bacteroidia bacterium]